MSISFSSVSFYNNKFKFSLSYSITIIQMQYDMEDRRSEMMNRKNMGKTGYLFLAAAMVMTQIAAVGPVYATDQEYAGTTQIRTSDIYPVIDTSAVELEIKEVYAEEGTQLAEADAENAEYIRTYQTNEVKNALMDHEEALEDIGDRITELEEGIVDGSYDTSSSASSGGNETITEIWILNE